jgi:hypothetical protein
VKLTLRQRAIIVAVVLGDIGTGRDAGDPISNGQIKRGDALADWLETMLDDQPPVSEFYDASLTVAEAAMRDELNIDTYEASFRSPAQQADDKLG